MFSFKKNTNGQIGIAFYDGGVTIGQCAWKNGRYQHPNVKRIDANPREITAEKWQSYLNRASISGSDCVLSLPPSIAHHQVLRLPNMSVHELKEAAAWEMVDRLGIERSSLQFDAIPVGTGGDVLALAIEQQTLSSLLDPLYCAGLRPTAIEPLCYSVARTLSMLHRRQSDQSVVRCVLDFGMHDSAFMVLAGDTLVFYKHLEHNGTKLVEAIATHTDVTVDQAERMLSCSQNEEDVDICKVVRDATRSIHESIATDAMKCVRHYGVTNRGPLSTKIIVTGSAGWNCNLAEVLSNSCSQEVFPDRESQHIRTLPSEIVDSNGWHAALGASLSSINQQRRVSDTSMKGAA
jgi:Tfp pilus assembly PilM family ATPase